MAPVWSKHLRVTKPKDDKGNEILTAEPVSDEEQAAATDCIRACTQALPTEIKVGDYIAHGTSYLAPRATAYGASGGLEWVMLSKLPPGVELAGYAAEWIQENPNAAEEARAGATAAAAKRKHRPRPRARQWGHAHQASATVRDDSSSSDS
jgi:Fe-S oxidoreductase